MAERPPTARYISKSSYMAGLDCPRKLWQRLWDRDSAAPFDGITRLHMYYGIRFGELARSQFPGGILIDIDIRNLDRAAADTRRAIAEGAEVIFEATFCHERCRVLSDIVEKQSDGTWHLTEVKSSGQLKPEHIPELAYQKWVIEQAGYAVSGCGVLHANKQGTWPDRDSIFIYEDVSERVNLAGADVPRRVEWMKELARPGSQAPDARENYSKTCHDCEFKTNVCWRDIDEPTIYDVVHATRIPLLEAEGVLYLKDIPACTELSAANRRHVNLINRRGIDIDRHRIQTMLEGLEYPIHFLDFETASVPIPMFAGNHPWQKIAFQYSLHILEEDGTLRHVDYLHDARSDPTVFIARSLCSQIGDAGSIVAYHADMEKGVLEDLAERAPESAELLLGMARRLWDLELVFKHYYRDWRFGSKSSIKVVLPALVPELSYEDQEIQDGGAASWGWIQMLESDDLIEQRQKADALRSYCKLDTLAMVKLLEHVCSAVSSP